MSHEEMCRLEGGRWLQKGMTFKPRGPNSVLLMSRRHDALYQDRIEDDGRVLIYQGHDDRPRPGSLDSKLRDQPLELGGKPTDNGKFHAAALAAKGGAMPHRVHVYEKLMTGVWVFNGGFELVDSWTESSGGRQVCKFKLRLLEEAMPEHERELEHSRIIPSDVKAAVWSRDKGVCVKCGSATNLHFDHVLPYSRGGTSLLAANIQILCAKHNLGKSDRIAD